MTGVSVFSDPPCTSQIFQDPHSIDFKNSEATQNPVKAYTNAFYFVKLQE